MKDKILFVVSMLFGLMMANAGLNKFLQYMPIAPVPGPGGELLAAFAASGWIFPLVALVELVGGILFIIPRFRALGAIIIFPIVLGIFIFHLAQDPASLKISIPLILINLWAIADNYAKYLPMIQSKDTK